MSSPSPFPSTSRKAYQNPDMRIVITSSTSNALQRDLSQEVKAYDPGASNFISAAERVEDTETLRCICGYTFEEGESIWCEGCGHWQHKDCLGLDRVPNKALPEKWYCWLCKPEYFDWVDDGTDGRRRPTGSPIPSTLDASKSFPASSIGQTVFTSSRLPPRRYLLDPVKATQLRKTAKGKGVPRALAASQTVDIGESSALISVLDMGHYLIEGVVPPGLIGLEADEAASDPCQSYHAHELLDKTQGLSGGVLRLSERLRAGSGGSGGSTAASEIIRQKNPKVPSYGMLSEIASSSDEPHIRSNGVASTSSTTPYAQPIQHPLPSAIPSNEHSSFALTPHGELDGGQQTVKFVSDLGFFDRGQSLDGVAENGAGGDLKGQDPIRPKLANTTETTSTTPSSAKTSGAARTSRTTNSIVGSDTTLHHSVIETRMPLSGVPSHDRVGTKISEIKVVGPSTRTHELPLPSSLTSATSQGRINQRDGGQGPPRFWKWQSKLGEPSAPLPSPVPQRRMERWEAGDGPPRLRKWQKESRQPIASSSDRSSSASASNAARIAAATSSKVEEIDSNSCRRNPRHVGEGLPNPKSQSDSTTPSILLTEDPSVDPGCRTARNTACASTRDRGQAPSFSIGLSLSVPDHYDCSPSISVSADHPDANCPSQFSTPTAYSRPPSTPPLAHHPRRQPLDASPSIAAHPITPELMGNRSPSDMSLSPSLKVDRTPEQTRLRGSWAKPSIGADGCQLDAFHGSFPMTSGRTEKVPKPISSDGGQALAPSAPQRTARDSEYPFNQTPAPGSSKGISTSASSVKGPVGTRATTASPQSPSIPFNTPAFIPASIGPVAAAPIVVKRRLTLKEAFAAKRRLGSLSEQTTDGMGLMTKDRHQ